MARDFTARELWFALNHVKWAHNAIIADPAFVQNEGGDRLQPSTSGTGFVILRDAGTQVFFATMASAMEAI